LRTAGERERAAVQRLLDAAPDASAATIERVSDTLHAAALDDDAREQMRGGCLEQELRHAGLGFDETAVVAKRRPAPAKPDRAAEAERKRALTAARARVERAEHALAGAEDAVAAARAALHAAEQDLHRLLRD
jgi:hypothetical protein